MSPIIKEQLEAKIDNLLKIFQGLKKLQGLSLNDLQENIENVWAVTFGLVAGIEAILDISHFILASKGIKVESYGSMPEKLFEAKIIGEDFKEKLGEMLGFRNRAIHNYPSLDIRQLHGALQEDINDFKEFLEIAKNYI